MPPALMSFAAAWSADYPAGPGGSSVLVAAVAWIQQTLLGTVATTIAVIAVASVGLMMLSGRASLRYGATVIGGCFILFGAATIVAGIESFAGRGDAGDVVYRSVPPPPPSLPPPAVEPGANDPYAGASVPSR